MQYGRIYLNRGDLMYLELNESRDRINTTFDKDGKYCIYMSSSFENWEYRLMDFIGFNIKHNIPYELNVDDAQLEYAKSVYGLTNFNDPIRKYEKNVLVHSTTNESWKKIQKSMIIKSWKKAKDDGDLEEIEPIGVLLNDPVEFRDYVMLGGFNHYNEIVVMCKQLGKLIYDENKSYEPGARIYVDAEKLANDGLLLRDGIHLKVRSELDLKKYMIASITPKDLENMRFTPLTFSNKADKLFKNKFR